MTLYELRQKEVINCCDGHKIGYVCDVEIDIQCCKVKGFIIPGPCKLYGFLGREKEYVIPCECVRRIGTDVILIEVNLEETIRECEY